jgi:hypothetical protein
MDSVSHGAFPQFFVAEFFHSNCLLYRKRPLYPIRRMVREALQRSNVTAEKEGLRQESQSSFYCLPSDLNSPRSTSRVDWTQPVAFHNSFASLTAVVNVIDTPEE